jgi:hypothetical protein
MLAESHGSVRCGHCNNVFDALRSLADQLPSEQVQQLGTNAGGGAPPQLTVPALRPAAGQQALLFDPDERPTRARRGSTPAFARARRGRPATRNWPWTLGATGLLLCLLVQIGYAERATVLEDVHARPLLDRVCETFGCHLPLRHEPAKLELLSRDIRPHPSVAHALIISATLRNAADFTQAFPAVEIALSDLDENRIAMRRFQPLEYLGDAHAAAAGLAPGATAALVFEVADPGKNAVAFEFRFL